MIKGGTVFEARTGAYSTPIAVLDFASLYPVRQPLLQRTILESNAKIDMRDVSHLQIVEQSLMIANNLSFETIILDQRTATSMPQGSYIVIPLEKSDPVLLILNSSSLHD